MVIAHRGASGYLPEHTLAGKVLAFAFGADYLEQDVVATADDQLVVLHDIHLDRVTDVVERYPERHRSDGRWYARDFTLRELQQLSVYERMNEDRSASVFPDRYPHRSGHFSIPTLEEELALVETLAAQTGRRVGVYPEVKRPAWHREEGVDVARLLLEQLKAHGYTERRDPVYVQCFDARETRRIREELGCELRLVQLVADNTWQESETDYDALLTGRGLERVAEYADAVGPWLQQLYDPHPGGAVSTGVAERAHDCGLAVHPYTFRADALSPGFGGYEEMVRWFVDTLAIDGLFTDFSDLTIKALGERRGPASTIADN